MEKKINLEDVFNNNFNCYTEFDLNQSCIDEEPAMTKAKFKELCLEFGKQLLELAAENAIVFETEQDIERRNNCVDDDTGEIIDEIYFFDPAFVDKQSILDTIKQIEL